MSVSKAVIVTASMLQAAAGADPFAEHSRQLLNEESTEQDGFLYQQLLVLAVVVVVAVLLIMRGSAKHVHALPLGLLQSAEPPRS